MHQRFLENTWHERQQNNHEFGHEHVFELLAGYGSLLMRDPETARASRLILSPLAVLALFHPKPPPFIMC